METDKLTEYFFPHLQSLKVNIFYEECEATEVTVRFRAALENYSY